MNLSNLELGDSELAQTLKLRHEESMSEQIDAFGQKISKLRDEAVAYRKASGIEDIWRKAEENYLGIDDENRHEFEGQTWAKPLTLDSPVQYGPVQNESPRSTLFVKLTSRYVDASAARMGETLLPVDDKPFAISNTPIPEMEEAAKDGTPVALLPNGMPLPNPENPQMPLTVADIAQKKIAEASKKAEAAEKRIWDWLGECNYAGELRKCIHDAARIGVAVIKGPVPIVKKSRMAQMVDGAFALTFKQEVQPGSAWVDPWNFYPDPACGEDIHDGSYVWEHDSMSAKQLREFIGQPGYLDSQIKKVLKEGPGKCNTLGFDQSSNKHKFDVWNFFGLVKKSEMDTLNAVGVEDIDADDDEMVSASLTLVNDSVIQAVMNPLDSGEIPYDTMSWKRRSGSWAGVGIGEDLFSPQRMINGATRRMMDNAGLSAGVQMVMDRGAVYPEDGSWVITPNKIWCKAEDSPTSDVRQAMATFVIPSMQGELMNIIQYALRLAEESAGLPLIAQGQSGISSPDTATAASLQNTNANTMMRRVAKAFDDGISTRHINRYYDWLMMDPTVPKEEKGDFQVIVHGSSALVERSIQDQFILQIAQMSANPAFRFDPAKIAAEICKSRFIDPERVQFSEEDFAKMQQAQGQQPPPQIAVAQIREQGAMQRKQMELQADAQKSQLQAQTNLQEAQMERDRDTMYVQSELQRNQSEHYARMQELQLKMRIAELEFAMENKLSLDEAKTKLAIESAKLNTTKELAMFNAKASQLPKPPVEPPGRAQTGQSFSQ